MTCVICETRKPRRYCPAVRGEICTVCCGTEREQSIDCPLECSYLQDAHEHERLPEVDAGTIPNQDIAVSEDFLEANEILLALLALSVFEGAMQQPGATDWDVREALEALVKTFRTMQSGIYYEAVPDNRYAAGIAAYVQAKIAEIRKKELEISGVSTIRDTTLTGLLAFLQRLEIAHNNGRKRGRAFLDFLRGFCRQAETPADSEAPQPEAPRVIL